MTMQVMLYMPVIHQGYDSFLEKYGRNTQVLLIGRSFADEFPVVRKEIRAISPEHAKAYIELVHDASEVCIIEKNDLPNIVTGPSLVLPDEDLLRDIAKRYELGASTKLIFKRTFLRWDKSWSRASRPPHYTGRVTTEQFASFLGRLALDVGSQSSDWWRQVGAVVVRDREIVATGFNQHLPSDYSPYVNGDPRNNYRRGVRIDLSTAIHAEAAVIGNCARRGISLEGADLYVSTFPCPSCARLVVAAGFARCFFSGGYSMLDGDEILRSGGVEPVYVVAAEGEDYRQLSFDDIRGSNAIGSN